MKKILMTICLIGGLAMLWSCSDDKDSYPVPSDIENLKATPAPEIGRASCRERV